MAPGAGSSRLLGYVRVFVVLMYSAFIMYYFATGWRGARKFAVLMVPLSMILWVLDSL